jgi:predicted RecA/RadA family phage recombinase
MKNFVQDGKAITLTAGDTVASGDYVVVGALRGVAVGDAEIDQPLTILTSGVFTIPSDNGVIEGDAVEWDGSQVVTQSGGEKVGVAVSDAAGTGVVNVKISC